MSRVGSFPPTDSSFHCPAQGDTAFGVCPVASFVAPDASHSSQRLNDAGTEVEASGDGTVPYASLRHVVTWRNAGVDVKCPPAHHHVPPDQLDNHPHPTHHEQPLFPVPSSSLPFPSLPR